ncbi:MAG: YbaK/EbsC family protein [Frankiales bacterium]|nr:YbaK/EbsC family protein [Frankiales bacterium]
MAGRQQVQAVLEQVGMAERVRTLEQSARTAVEAAAALGCEVGAIGSSLVFLAEDEPVLVLTSGAHRVDVDLLAEHLGGRPVRMAKPDRVREVTGFAIGGVAPVGLSTALAVLVDEDLAQYPQVWVAAGDPHSVFWTTYDELLALTGGRSVRVA